jgi:hypothetical protein
LFWVSLSAQLEVLSYLDIEADAIHKHLKSLISMDAYLIALYALQEFGATAARAKRL